MKKILEPAITILINFCCGTPFNHGSSYQHIKGINPISLKLRATPIDWGGTVKTEPNQKRTELRTELNLSKQHAGTG